MTYKVLLIDDSKTQLDVLKLRLIKSGFDVETSSSAVEGYRKIFSIAPDIILSDVVMPEMDGYQFCRLVKNNNLLKNIPIILLTVLDKSFDKFWGKKAGADAFISKDTDFENIKDKMNEVLEKSILTQSDKENIIKHEIDNISVNEQMNTILNELLMESIFLNEFRTLGEYYNHEDILVQKMFDLLSSFIEYDFAGIYFKYSDMNLKNILYIDTKDTSASPLVLEKIKRDFFASIPSLPQFNTIDFLHQVVRENKDDEINKIRSVSEFKSSLILPVYFEKNLLGGVWFYSKTETDYTKIKFYETLKKELGTIFNMKSLYNKVEFLSITDGLTELYNRRHFETNVEREFLRAKRYKNMLSLAILDIDHFKSVNDTYGHQYGDYVLKEVSNLMKSSFRKTDMVYRYGGEELSVILPETSMDNAIIPLERLREKISQYNFCYNGTSISLTVSIGVSEMKSEYNDSSDLIKTADLALYNAKETGRNKVIKYNERITDCR